MPTKTKQWKSSWQVFKESLDLAYHAWFPIFIIVMGQVLLMVLFALYVQALGLEGFTKISTGDGLVGHLAFLFLLYLYYVFYTVVLVNLLDKKDYSLKQVFDARLARKLFPAFILSVLITIGITVGSFIFIIPGVLLTVWWSFAVYALVLEDLSVGQSLKRSYSLVKGWWWPVFERIIFVLLVSAIISFFGIVPLAGTLVATILSLIISPVLIVFIGRTYQEVAAIKKSSKAAAMPFSFGMKLLLILWAIVVLGLLSVGTAASQFVLTIIGNAGSDQFPLSVVEESVPAIRTNLP